MPIAYSGASISGICGQDLEGENLLDIVLGPHPVAPELEFDLAVVIRAAEAEIRHRLRNENVIGRQAAERLDPPEREFKVLGREIDLRPRRNGDFLLIHGNGKA